MAENESRLFGDIDVEERSVPVREWLWLVVAWDGVLPFVVLGVPMLTQWAWPRQRDLQDAVSVLVVIGVFLIRFAIGLIHISRNQCGPKMRTCQKLVLFCAAFFFVLFDIMTIDLQAAFKRGVRLRPDEQLFILAIYFAYLIVMAFALYPGKRVVPRVHSSIGNE